MISRSSRACLVRRISAAAAIGWIAVAASGPAAGQSQIITVGAAGTGGVYYALGGGIANLISRHAPGVTASARVTGGSVDNLKLIGTDPSYIGLTSADVAIDAVNGAGRFSAGKIPARALMLLYANQMQVVTVEDRGISSIPDLKNRRVSTGPPGSGIEVMALRLIAAAGLDPEADMRRERLNAAESLRALTDGKIDAFFFVGGTPAAAILSLAASHGAKLRLIDHAGYLGALTAKYGPIYSGGVIKAGTYPGYVQDNKVISVWNMLAAHAQLGEDTASAIVKAVFENKGDLVAIVRDAENIVLENQVAGNTAVPFHPGAARYYAGQGVRTR
jgi:TRAP transporter TAXI family solute receptor